MNVCFLRLWIYPIFETSSLIEQVEIATLLLFLLDDGGLGGALGGRGRLGNRGSSGRGGGGLESLDGGDTLDTGLENQGSEVLEGAGDGVGDTGLGGHADLSGEGGQVGQSSGDLGVDGLVGDVQNSGVEDGTVVVDELSDQTVREGMDLKLLKQNLLRHLDLNSSLKERHVVDNLDLSLNDLRGDVKRLEEVSLGGVETGGTGGDGHINRGEDTGLGGGGDLVGQHDLADLIGLRDAEDETNVSSHDLNEGAQVEVGVLLLVLVQGSANHGVLSHENVSLASQRDTDLLHLLGSDVVTRNDENTGARVQQVLELIEISGLLCELFGISWCHFEGEGNLYYNPNFNPRNRR